MRIELPLFVQSGTADMPKGVSSVRPLFFERPVESDREIARARGKLANRLTKLLGEMARDGNHRELARYTFCPELELHSLKFRMDLRRQSFQGRFPVVTFRHLSRRIAFSPLLPEMWFELLRGGQLETRALEVYTEFFRKVERRDEEDLRQLLSRFEPKGKTWIDYLEIDLSTGQRLDSGRDGLLALLGEAEHVDGATELERVGTCLDHLYPEQLRRFSGPGANLTEMERLFDGAKRQAVLVVGTSLVGKTTLVHEFVFRRVAQRRSPFGRKAKVWHLAPQRLISGMMYLGQWENRLLAILKHARKRDHVLFFDDILGLYHAGLTSNSDLSVADVLKPYVERGDVRVLAEMTPEALRVFCERDRGFADLFHLVRLEEPPARELVPLLLALIRSLELRHRCRFDIDVLPTVLELTRRYQPDLSYPGKAAILIERLAVAHGETEIDRDCVLDEFRRQSGLDTRFLDRHVRLPREEIVAGLSSQIVGQQEAVDAMADVVSVAKARLNDPQKPLASMLLLGPTGVGKTECAKALARFLFHDEQRLLRFDMNEFLSAEAAARLVGTFDRPEGLLTSAIRERPAAVVLLDEIEKAHANVFDLLLQILGEARLSDALGRTVDFSNAIVLLTSNLGTGQSSVATGFGGRDSDCGDALLRAVRDFFRPELLNRLDRIIPFVHLGRNELAQIARRTLSQVLAREGFQRRQSALDISPDALSWVVDQGYHPQLGARAMKRAVEDHVVRPLAVQLAEVPKEVPTVISLTRRDDRLDAEVSSLHEAEPDPQLERPSKFADPSEALARARRVLDRIELQCAAYKSPEGLGVGCLSPNGYWYLALSEYLAELRQRVRWLADRTEQKRVSEVVPLLAARQPKDRLFSGGEGARQVLKEMVAAQDIHDYLADMRRAARARCNFSDRSTMEMLRLFDSLAVLHAFGPSEEGWPHENVVVIVRSLPDAGQERACLANEILPCQAFGVALNSASDEPDSGPRQWYGLAATHWASEKAETSGTKAWWELLPDRVADWPDLKSHHMDVLTFEGPRAGYLLEKHQGTYLFTDPEGRLKPVQVLVVPAASEEGVGQMLAEYLDWRKGGRGGNDRFGWQPVVAVYAWQKTSQPEGSYRRMIDLRRGLDATTSEGIHHFDAFRASLPLPPELEE